jgi:hypothetical protein
VGLFPDYVAQWDKLVSDYGRDAVLAYLQQSNVQRIEGLPERVQRLEREYFLIGHGLIDPDDPSHLAPGSRGPSAPGVVAGEPHAPSHVSWEEWVIDHCQESLEALATQLTGQQLRHLIHTKAGMCWDPIPRRLTRVVLDLDASQSELIKLWKKLRTLRADARKLMAVEEPRRPSPNQRWELHDLLSFALAIQHKARTQRGISDARLYKRLLDSTASEQNAKKQAHRYKEQAQRHVDVELRRYKWLRQQVAEAERRAAQREWPLRVEPAWISASMPHTDLP